MNLLDTLSMETLDKCIPALDDTLGLIDISKQITRKIIILDSNF